MAVEASIERESGPDVLAAAPARDRRRVVADLLALAKPRVVLMVLVVTIVGYDLGLDGEPDYRVALHLLLGTMLAAGGALALNQYGERIADGHMERTRTRPLPDGRLAPAEALAFGASLTLIGVVHLALWVNVRAAAVTAVTALLYLFVYTPLKRRTPLCTLAGAVPGALPPVTGWMAAREDLGLGAAVLFGILFLWQLPHTLAIARLYRDDYAQGGVQVLPVVDLAGRSTERHIVLGSLGLVPVSLLPTLIGLAGALYFVGALAAGIVLAVLGARHAITPSSLAARRVLLGSLLYLPLVLALLALDKT
jgi:protoheme IX farnesyltransferase